MKPMKSKGVKFVRKFVFSKYNSKYCTIYFHFQTNMTEVHVFDQSDESEDSSPELSGSEQG